jgi:hypothetical protein
MDDNVSVWDYYQPGFVHPGYVPYLRKNIKDKWGNTVNVNTWEKQGPPGMVAPELVRINKGMSFMRMFESDPCPPGWEKVPDDSAMCVQRKLKHEPIFYSDKAFIAKRQYWKGTAVQIADPRYDRRVSEQTDLRSVNPLTGQYTIYYKPVESSAHTKYGFPLQSQSAKEPGKYDQNWNLPRDEKYLGVATKDSYLA